MSATLAPTASARRVLRLIPGMPTQDGAGVRLTRLIGTPMLADLDPFLMLDEFGTDRPQDYIAGFPDHPHRGFETVTYMIDGRMRHKDNQGNEGVLVPGAVQWMTAGRGLVHSEMPEQQEGRMRGFQLWINLPARDKMTAPKYQEYAPDALPVVEAASGARVKLIAGSLLGAEGPIVQPATDPVYFDLDLAPGAALSLPVPAGHAAFLYVYEGGLDVLAGVGRQRLARSQLAVLGEGGELVVQGGAEATRAILVAGRPLREPVARYGPFVMNTREELMQAFVDYQEGRFV
jgi:quercetin 2,3-dioxygenase